MAMTIFLKFSLLYIALCQVVSTQADGSSELQVHVPKNLFKDGGYEHRESLFGNPPFGGSITQNVYYADSEFCDKTDKAEHEGWPQRDTDQDGKMKPWPTPFILMVDRGGCSFVQKVRNAQFFGAAAVIIADNLCLCSDAACAKASSNNDVCEAAEPVMADDGSGSDISIPSFLIFKTDADLIKNELKNNQMVLLEMTWSLPTPDDRVEYDLWTTPSNPASKDFIKGFRPLTESLDNHAYFTPHMYIYDGIKQHCQGKNGENMCSSLCTNNGRYCATDPDNDVEQGISGADVVTESLRRICIWKYSGEEDGIGKEWWNYNEEFLAKCDTPESFMNQDCVDDALKHANIDKDTIERCMKDSGGLKGDVSNSLLEKELESQAGQGVVVLPTVFVNHIALRGAVSIDSIFSAVCAGYKEGTQPEICATCIKCPDLETCVKNKGCNSGTDTSNGYKLYQIIEKLWETIFFKT